MPESALLQVLTDVGIDKTALSWKGKDLGQVHGGFRSAVLPFIKPLLDLVQYSEVKKITITGHSLGAAEALIFGAILEADQPDLQVYIHTFGSPRTGSPMFVKTLTDASVDVIRFVNGIDMVTMLPSSIGLGDSVLHAGQQVTLNSAGVSDTCKDWFINNQYMALLKSPYSTYTGCLKEAELGPTVNMLPNLALIMPTSK